jgi:orotate phosphoribosyltransferase
MRQPYDWLSELKESQSYWYEPNPQEVHALLSSSKHSNGYINLREFAKERPSRMRNLILDFYLKHEAELLHVLETSGIDYIHGPAMGGVLPAFEIANLMGVGYLYTEKQILIEVGKKTTNIVCNFDNLEDKHILLLEDVLSTGSTNAKSVVSLIEKGAQIVGPLCVLVNRTGHHTLLGQEILSLIETQFEVHEDEASCPWCKNGSHAVTPKHLWKTFSS